jgi:predicted dienelactone hydrolase
MKTITVFLIASLLVRVSTTVAAQSGPGGDPAAVPGDTPAASFAVGIARPGLYAVVPPRVVRLQDAKRKKEVPVSVTAPSSGGGPFPVIVFSHGAGADGRKGFGITSYWASHGYVVLCPTHADSVALARERGGTGGGGLRDVLSRATRDPLSGVERARDVSFVLDSLDQIGREVPGLAARLDKKRVGVGGHSLGAYTAQLVGGATVTLPGSDKPESFRDQRVRAVLQLSGQGTGQQGLTKDSWKSMDVPMMTVTGTRDRGARGQGPEWKKEPFDFSPPSGNKYHLLLTGAHHGSFTGRFAGVAPAATTGGAGSAAGGSFGLGGDQKAVFGCVEAATLAFWDVHLRGEAKAKAYLGSDALAKEAGAVVTFYRK